jgi:hypothetical protein
MAEHLKDAKVSQTIDLASNNIGKDGEKVLILMLMIAKNPPLIPELQEKIPPNYVLDAFHNPKKFLETIADKTHSSDGYFKLLPILGLSIKAYQYLPELVLNKIAGYVGIKWLVSYNLAAIREAGCACNNLYNPIDYRILANNKAMVDLGIGGKWHGKNLERYFALSDDLSYRDVYGHTELIRAIYRKENIPDEIFQKAAAKFGSANLLEYIMATNPADRGAISMQFQKFTNIINKYLVPQLKEVEKTANEIYQDLADFVNEPLVLIRKAEMQKLANKHGVGIKVVDGESLQSAFKEIAKKTHPDRNVNNGEESENLVADFIKATGLVKERDTNKITSEICNPIMEKLMGVNVILRVTDVAIDTVRGIMEGTEESVMKASVGYVQLAAMYKGQYGIIPLLTCKDAVYQAYQGEYEGAVNTAAIGVGLPLIAVAVYAKAPVIGTVMSIGFTLHGVYGVLNNMYDLGCKMGNSIYDLCYHNANAEKIEMKEEAQLEQLEQNNAYNNTAYYEIDHNMTEEWI